MSERKLREVFSRVGQETAEVTGLREGVLRAFVTLPFDSDKNRRKAGKGNEPIKWYINNYLRERNWYEIKR